MRGGFYEEADDYVEWGLPHEGPAGAPNNTQRGRVVGDEDLGGGHIALLVPDMAKAVEIVKAKPARKDYACAAQQETHVGVNHKWQGNFFGPGGTRSEFMEEDTADGLPSPVP